jgi:mono/diheme cytochrome c family protein
MRARVLVGAAVLGLLAAGCRRDMQDQPKYPPLRRSAFFADGRSARPLVPGTVAREHRSGDTLVATGRAGTEFVRDVPVAITRDLLARGRERYDIHCSPCHDRVGNGDGMIVRRGFRRPPSFHDARLRQAPAGYVFDVITRGFGVMPAYAVQVPGADRWAIVAYIRALQLSQNATLADVPESERAALEGDGS